MRKRINTILGLVVKSAKLVREQTKALESLDQKLNLERAKLSTVVSMLNTEAA